MAHFKIIFVAWLVIIPMIFCHENSIYKLVNGNIWDKNTEVCVTNIINNYFSEYRFVTYVANATGHDNLLAAIQYTNNVSIIIKKFEEKLKVLHKAYIITVDGVNAMVDCILNLKQEPNWNPRARFLILIKAVESSDLKSIFDTLLFHHIDNVVVISSTKGNDVYSYNPFDNFTCGKTYNNVINYGTCFATEKYNLYPNKYETGLQNCKLTVVIPHAPPYVFASSYLTKGRLRLGVEPYFLNLIAQKEGFKVKVIAVNKLEEFCTVNDDMKATGTLNMLQTNEADMMAGGMVLIPSRAHALDYLCGHLSYTDEIRFIVKQAPFVPLQKNFYLEFDLTIWVLVILTLVIYSVLVISLTRTEDKSAVVLELLKCLVAQNCKIRSRMSVNYVLIIWGWFALVISIMYQSSLASLLTNPVKEYQVSTEEDLARYKYKPCFSCIMSHYYDESVQVGYDIRYTKSCKKLIESGETVLKSDNLYTLFEYRTFKFYKLHFYNEYGESRAYAFNEPYSKVIYVIYTYKGFPFTKILSTYLLKLRENGIVDKALQDMSHFNWLKYHFKEKGFVSRFGIPWIIYISGCSVATITFALEVMVNGRNNILLKVTKDVNNTELK